MQRVRCITSRLRSCALDRRVIARRSCVHLVPMVLAGWMVGALLFWLLWLGFHARPSCAAATWLARVAKTYTISPAGAGRSPFSGTDLVPPPSELHRQTGGACSSSAGTLKENAAALAVEPGCASDCSGTTPMVLQLSAFSFRLIPPARIAGRALLRNSWLVGCRAWTI